jgi:hypothetical protein
VALQPRWRMRKSHALAAFASQLQAPTALHSQPVLTAELLSSVSRDWEMVFL